jgi:UDP-N-acetylglucosamine 1-carboxyvinyltransferase
MPDWITWVLTVHIPQEVMVDITVAVGGLTVREVNGLHGVDVITETPSEFLADLQVRLMALMSVVGNAS